MLRVAMLSRWHVHANQYAGETRANPDADVVAVWDEDGQRGTAWAEELGVPFEADLDVLLASDDIDAVCVVTPTNLHGDVMVRAANAGKHIFTEKVLATTVADCEAIADAVTANGVKFCISFPRRTIPQILYAKQALDEGLFGQVTALRVRIAHDGAVRDWLPTHFYDAQACGGGAMMDLGAHGMYLSRWLLGAPKRIVSVFNTVTGRAVDDNTVSVIEFENGAIAVNETSFTGFGGSYSLEIDGTEGGYRMLSPGEGVEVRSRHLDGNGWQRPEQLPQALAKPIDQWVAGCVHGTPIEFGLADAIQLTELMAAAYVADGEARSVSFG
ncbi:MAG: Gfo/Idh/MocA family oxidoreductase [Gammaproteobacteria bacterium]|nr:Gfo/Idh/MocA family oxidoreductase [Gammaproteobacteria bacterium]